ncbi:MAG: hypothetical protein E7156_07000 [Streptococcus gallolyticus]|uniref:Uncharacterized protein n=1 Tax=Streptococcus gallolyticus TaxID=315405 RepID=A0A928AB80_9STRE|nr:hypothetical protein [Streptococcus gallolyticus]
MKIKNITQTPFGTILSLSDNLPNNSVGSYITVDGGTLHQIKGTPSNVWTEILIDKTDNFKIGQEIIFKNIA